ncbi:MAG: hypothetical protein A2542_00555 [Parcubacteria group bacterium RIFOXYD2_FULL_52_8]|nr:MAG: hypothetical protein A2542_00555 [Parcubacteria group bacterium RIFOXYD2_FULL_52_8]
MPIIPINYFAVVGAAVVSIVLGFLWYGPLFGKQWIAMMGWTEEQCSDAQKKGMGAKTYVPMIVGALIMAYVLSYSLVFASTYLQASGASAGLMAGFWNWLGFIAPVIMGSVLWEGKSWKLWVLNSGYYLVSLCLMGMVLAVWQ